MVEPAESTVLTPSVFRNILPTHTSEKGFGRSSWKGGGPPTPLSSCLSTYLYKNNSRLETCVGACVLPALPVVPS